MGMLRRCAQVPALSRNYYPVGFWTKCQQDGQRARQCAEVFLSQGPTWELKSKEAPLQHELATQCTSHHIFSAKKKTFTMSLTRESRYAHQLRGE